MRVFDASAHNRIVNHPAVKPAFSRDDGDLSFDDLADNPDYALLTNEDDAAAIFEWCGPGVWQVHTLCLPSCRGARAIAEARRMMDWMFTNEGARMIWGLTPVGNRAAVMFNRLCGAVSHGFRDHHVSGRCEIFSVERF
jgi:hypothetical protein